MPYSKLVLGLVLLSLAAAFGQQARQPDYSGTWRLQADDSVKLVLEQKDSTIHMKEFKGTDTRADYSCNTMGKECEVKYEGHRAKVSFWFNGQVGAIGNTWRSRDETPFSTRRSG